MEQIHISTASRKIIHTWKIGCKNLRKLEINCGKSRNSGASLDKTWVLMISVKHLRINKINCSIKESFVKNYDNHICIITYLHNQSHTHTKKRNYSISKNQQQKNSIFQQSVLKKVQNLMIFGQIIAH